MMVAVACDGLSVAPRFVQCTSYMCYTVDHGVVVSGRNIPALDQPLEKLPEFFDAIHADVLVAGAIEDGVANHLRSAGIDVAANASGDPLTAVRSLCAGHATV